VLVSVEAQQLGESLAVRSVFNDTQLEVGSVVLVELLVLYETRLKFTIRPCPQLLVEPSG
jgi:hypothetical protein